MRILLVSGKTETDDLYKSHIGSVITELLKLPDFTGGTHKLGIIIPDDHNQIEILDNGVISFKINCTGGEAVQIPNLTPNLIRELNGFLNEFQPDIVHSFDAGFIGVITQFFSVSKKIPYVLALLPGHDDQERGLTSKILGAILGQSGVSSEFIKNYYNNATVLIGKPSELTSAIEKSRFSGKVVSEREIVQGTKLMEFYNKLLSEQKRTAKNPSHNSSVENKKKAKKIGLIAFLIAGATIAGSIFAFSATKGLGIFKPKRKPEVKSNPKSKH